MRGLAGATALCLAHESCIAEGVTGTVAAHARYAGVGQCPLGPETADQETRKPHSNRPDEATAAVALAQCLGKAVEALSCHGPALPLLAHRLYMDDRCMPETVFLRASARGNCPAATLGGQTRLGKHPDEVLVPIRVLHYRNHGSLSIPCNRCRRSHAETSRRLSSSPRADSP